MLKIASENQLLESTFLDLVESSDEEIYAAIKDNTKVRFYLRPSLLHSFLFKEEVSNSAPSPSLFFLPSLLPASLSVSVSLPTVGLD